MAIRIGRRGLTGWVGIGMAVLVVAGVALAGCAGSAAAEIDYVVDGPLSSYNPNTVVGAASAGAQAFARTLVGFSYHGPDGQTVPDRDFGTVSVVGGTPLVLDYQIADNAVYSDGKPVTCDDIVLAWAAQSGRYPEFNAATQAGYLDIANVECMPGQKKARVSFVPDRGIVDYNQLFTATTLMPSHVIADQLNVDVTAALLSHNAPLVAQIARLWNTIWDLKPGLKGEEIVKRFPSSGPYKLQAVLDGGAVVLVANDRWWGPKAITKRITVWPQGPDIQDRVNNRSVDVVDVAVGSSGTLATPDNYDRSDAPSDGIEQLIFAPQGPLSAPKARRAFALCTPRDVLAKDAGTPIANSRLDPAVDDAVSADDGAAEAAPFGKADPVAAREALGGAPLAVRIGYQGPNARLAVNVGVITRPAPRPASPSPGSPWTARARRRCGTARSTPCWPAPAARPAADRAGRRRWTPTPCTPATATTCPATPIRRWTTRSGRWRCRPTPPSGSGCWPRPPRCCGATCPRCRCTGSSAPC